MARHAPERLVLVWLCLLQAKQPWESPLSRALSCHPEIKGEVHGWFSDWVLWNPAVVLTLTPGVPLKISSRIFHLIVPYVYLQRVVIVNRKPPIYKHMGKIVHR